MNKSLKQSIVLPSLFVGAAVLILTGACAPSNLIPDATADYTHDLPPAAEIIKAKADVPDFFGDYSMCASFRLSPSEMDRLYEQGLNWFPPIEEDDDPSDNRVWETSVLSEDTVSYVNETLDGDLENSVAYACIDEWVEGGYSRWLVIDQEHEVVYYCRSSW